LKPPKIRALIFRAVDHWEGVQEMVQIDELENVEFDSVET
jgi:hypothetical protein